MKIASIQVGKPRTIDFQDKPVETGIFKEPVDGPVFLRTHHFEGDRQADLRVHGGVDKAVYAYSLDAYEDWRKLRPQDSFTCGAMGENLCIDSLPEDSIYIGDVYELENTLLEASEPRFPCHKLAAKFDDMAILKDFMEIGRPGVYFRVLREGFVQAGESLKLIHREKTLLSVSELFSFQRNPPIYPFNDPEKLLELSRLNSLPVAWRQKIKKRFTP